MSTCALPIPHGRALLCFLSMRKERTTEKIIHCHACQCRTPPDQVQMIKDCRLHPDSPRAGRSATVKVSELPKAIPCIPFGCCIASALELRCSCLVPNTDPMPPITRRSCPSPNGLTVHSGASVSPSRAALPQAVLARRLKEEEMQNPSAVDCLLNSWKSKRRQTCTDWHIVHSQDSIVATHTTPPHVFHHM